MGVAFEAFRDTNHPVTGEAGYDRMVVKAKTAKELIGFAVSAKDKQWHLESVNEESNTLVLYKPSGKQIGWHDPDAPQVPGALASEIRSAISSAEFVQRTKHRIAMGEVYVICSDCGGKIGSDDARPGETEDRVVSCPKKDRLTGKCGYDG